MHHLGPLFANHNSFTKLEVHNLSQTDKENRNTAKGNIH